jgi:hypothetical protein
MRLARRVVAAARRGMAWLSMSGHGFPAGGIMPAPFMRGVTRPGLARHGRAMREVSRPGESWMSRSAANPTTTLAASSGDAGLGPAGRGAASLGTARIPRGTDNSRTTPEASHGGATRGNVGLGEAWIPSAGDNRRTTTNPTGLARMERPGDAWRVQVWFGMARMPPRSANSGTTGAVQCSGLSGPGLEPPGKDSAPSG